MRIFIGILFCVIGGTALHAFCPDITSVQVIVVGILYTLAGTFLGRA
jgi:hypothetical protein